MATRERKPRNGTDSPISIVGDNSCTPSTKGRNSRNGRGRGRSRISRGRAASNTTDTTNNDDNESTQSIEEENLTQNAKEFKEDNFESKAEDNKITKTSPKQVGRRSRAATVVVQPASKRTRRSNTGGILRGGILKRRSLPVASTATRRRGNKRRSLPNKEIAIIQKVSPGRKSKKPVPVKKEIQNENNIFKKPVDMNSETATLEIGAVTDTEISSTRRRRSSSKSTDTIVSCPEAIDSSLIKKEEDMTTSESLQIKIEEDNIKSAPEQKQSILNKMAENFSGAKVLDIEINQTKRVGRPRRGTVSKDTRAKSKIRENKCIIPKIVESPKKVEYPIQQVEAEDIKLDTTAEIEKESSVSPLLDSEGISEISVRTFYGEPAFLENNLGIEKDPKLGEIVQKNVISETDPEIISKSALDSDSQLKETNDATVIAIEEDKENDSSVKESADKGKCIDGVRLEMENPKLENLAMDESAELLKEKEKHLFSLGLLTREAAVEAEKQKSKLREMRFRGNGAGKSEKRQRNSEYTGTLKTIIKLNRTSPEKRKTRMPLKMTIHKGKPKHYSEKDLNSSSASEQIFYIQSENQGEQQQESTCLEKEKGRKGQYRILNETAIQPELNDKEKDEKSLVLVIPEKASSFKVHPDRICLDQCFYCGGKFGLYDTPCHIAQMKSVDRQEKILKSEEKLTRDSCLCDACFRHVDRRANCPSYRKRLAANQSNSENESQNESKLSDKNATHEHEKDMYNTCCVESCNEAAVHSLRKKWISKMKKQVSKIINIDNDLINEALTLIPICDRHYQAISHLMICAMCKRRLPKNHIYFIAQDIQRLEELLYIQGVPMPLGDVSLIVCKLCRYYANLLLKPLDDKPQKINFIKTYSKRLTQQMNSVNEDNNELLLDQEVSCRSMSQLREQKKQRKMLDVSTIQDPDISIIPSKILSTNTSTPAAGHILLDNDVMVDYDTPIVEHVLNKGGRAGRAGISSKGKGSLVSDMARALKANPNISMRELFPGEDDMNLNINIPFGKGVARTPEGWARVQATVQYDEDTRTLWEELQKPYGNQSSFIRHLILLEKYYRNGDLILSPNASSHAMSYSESIQNRLRSYDNIPSVSTCSDSLNILQQLSNAPITIIPTGRNKQRSEVKVSTEKRKHSSLDNRRPKVLPNKVQKVDEQKGFPPDLISISPSTSQQNMSPSVTVTPSFRKSPGSSSNNQQIIKLPDTLTPSERKQTAKPWRPTLIPITAGSNATINSGPLYQTADGRKLPGLVQVMSGGKPYHISINDYNRMCILRREKLWQIQQQQQQQQRDSPRDLNFQKDSNQEAAKSASMQIPNQILEQNSLIPIGSAMDTSKALDASQKPRGSKSNGSSLLKNFVPIAPKLPLNTSLVAVPPTVSVTTKTETLQVPATSVVPALTTPATSTATGTSAIDALIKSQMQTNMWLWGEGLNAATPNMINNSGGSILVDNSVLSKIPKSLTVIAQQKGRSFKDSSAVSEDTPHV